jgi:N-methylhydantoinase A
MATRVAVDIGGPFTDLVHLDAESGAVGAAKASTTPRRFEDGVLEALGQADLDGVDFLAHGTTVIINALTERKGATTALITTRGFRDVLEIQKANRPDLYNLLYRKPEPFVRRRLRLEVTERVSYKGEVLTPLDEEDVRRAAADARRLGAEAVAISFLHSYANPAHERRAAEIVGEEWPEAPVAVSHELTSEWREYDRTSTVVLDAYVKPIAAGYLAALGQRLEEAGIRPETHYCMQSNGGISRFDVAAKAPIQLVESGPVGGVIGAAAIGRLIGERNLITLDIGGTTAKASLVEGDAVQLAVDYAIERTPSFAGYPIKVPVVDIVEIGAGGGSIAWIDPAGALKVGPRSAGAEPGPACYGWGGTEPTLTDANVLAGRINPGYFLGGKISLDVDGARAAFAPIAEALEVSVDDAALGVIRIANANMIHLLKLVSVRRGRDPRDFAIVAFGGGGSMHACALARELQVPRVIVPPNPGHFSAWGMLTSDLRHDVAQTRVGRVDRIAAEEIAEIWSVLEGRLVATFGEEGLAAGQVAFARAADMRYAGQEHTVRVPAGEGDALDEIERRFHDLHEQLYTFRLSTPIEFVNFRVTGVGTVPKPELRRLAGGGEAAAASKGSRDVDFDALGRREAQVFERALLGPGSELEGPAVVEEPAASTVVFPGQRLRVDDFGNLLIETAVDNASEALSTGPRGEG